MPLTKINTYIETQAGQYEASHLFFSCFIFHNLFPWADSRASLMLVPCELMLMQRVSWSRLPTYALNQKPFKNKSVSLSKKINNVFVISFIWSCICSSSPLSFSSFWFSYQSDLVFWFCHLKLRPPVHLLGFTFAILKVTPSI